MEILVLTISDRAYRGEYDDKSGPVIVDIIRKKFTDAIIRTSIVPDDKTAIRESFGANQSCNFVITTGGTGLSVRDITPEATVEYCDRMVPGIAEMIRAESLKETPYAALSRGISGMKGKCLIVNLPGSVKAVSSCTKLLIPLLEHASSMISGCGH